MRGEAARASTGQPAPEVAAAPRPPRLAAAGLSRCFGDRVVLRSLTFDVAPGEVFGLLGPNGAGKTTAFQVLTGLLPPDAGELRLDGAPLRPGAGPLRARMGVVFQQPSLDTRLSARQNLMLAGSLYRLPRALAVQRTKELLAFAELADRANEPVSRFSGGMKRRLEICRALVHEPEILVLDEPTSGLDEAAFQRTWRELLALRAERGLTILVTTHRPEEGEHCDRIGILDGGEIIACDSPRGLKARVSGDVLAVEAPEPAEISRTLLEKFGIVAREAGGTVFLEHPRGHELIPRIVEAFPTGRLRSVSLHRPSLSDVFLHLTGRALTETTRGTR
jgi:ABC-2 type transport system ATP-binding protein